MSRSVPASASLKTPRSAPRPHHPLPAIPSPSPPTAPGVAANRAAIIHDVSVCAAHLEAVNEAGESIASTVRSMLKSSVDESTDEERLAQSKELRKAIRAIDDDSRANIQRYLNALEWCASAQHEKIPEWDTAAPPCAALKSALDANKVLLVDVLGPHFEILRAVNGIPSYIGETISGLSDPNR